MAAPDLAAALLDALDDDALAQLAERLRPHLRPVENGPGLLTPEQAAHRLGLHPKTVARMAREGRLAGAVKVGKGWRFRPDGLVPAPPRRPEPVSPTVSSVRRARPSAGERPSVLAIKGCE